MYTRRDLINYLLDEYDCDDSPFTESAVDAFLNDIVMVGNAYPAIVISREDNDAEIEGNLDDDADYVYDTQRFWGYTETKPPELTVVKENSSPRMVDVELPEDPNSKDE